MKTTASQLRFRIRPASPADGESVAAMCTALSAAEGNDVQPGFTAEAFRRDGFGPDPAFVCLIAEMNGEAIGYALHCRDYDTDHLCRSLYLADLYVETAAHGRGIGRALMAATARAGRARGARLIMWHVLKSNLGARRFYSTVGAEIDGQIETWVGGEGFRRLAASPGGADGLALRSAVAADCPVLERFLAAMLNDIGQERRDNAASRLRADGFGADPAFAAVIAERGGEPVGYALFWPTYDTEAAARGAWLSDLYVVPEARRHGVAMRLMGEVARRSAAVGGHYLTWLVHEGNHAARVFYGRFAEEFHNSLACVCAGERFRKLAESAIEAEVALT
jgi:GNAT superfamily N-acetyltransferase